MQVFAIQNVLYYNKIVKKFVILLLFLVFLAHFSLFAARSSYDFTIYKTADNSVMGVSGDKLGLDVTGYFFFGSNSTNGGYFRFGVQTPFDTILGYLNLLDEKGISKKEEEEISDNKEQIPPVDNDMGEDTIFPPENTGESGNDFPLDSIDIPTINPPSLDDPTLNPIEENILPPSLDNNSDSGIKVDVPPIIIDDISHDSISLPENDSNIFLNQEEEITVSSPNLDEIINTSPSFDLDNINIDSSNIFDSVISMDQSNDLPAMDIDSILPNTGNDILDITLGETIDSITDINDSSNNDYLPPNSEINTSNDITMDNGESELNPPQQNTVVKASTRNDSFKKEWRMLFTLGPAKRRFMGEKAMVYLGYGLSGDIGHRVELEKDTKLSVISSYAILGADLDFGMRYNIENNTTIRVGAHFTTSLIGVMMQSKFDTNHNIVYKNLDIYGYSLTGKGIFETLQARGYIMLAVSFGYKNNSFYNYSNNTSDLGGGIIIGKEDV